MMPSVGMPELIIILVIALIIFGPRKLPELGRSLGKSIGEFRKASNELKSTLEEEIRMEEQKEQKTKLEAEQASAVAGGATIPETIFTPTAGAAAEPTAAEPTAEPTADEPTVHRTPTGTSA
jgi:TatA/E family protein of Tat protein translocase